MIHVIHDEALDIFETVSAEKLLYPPTAVKITRASSWITWIVCLTSTLGVIYMVIRNRKYPGGYETPLLNRM